MRAYLWFSLVICVLCVLGRAIWLGRGEFPRRTAGQAVVDLIFDLVMAGWALGLLLQGGAHA